MISRVRCRTASPLSAARCVSRLPRAASPAPQILARLPSAASHAGDVPHARRRNRAEGNDDCQSMNDGMIRDVMSAPVPQSSSSSYAALLFQGQVFPVKLMIFHVCRAPCLPRPPRVASPASAACFSVAMISRVRSELHLQFPARRISRGRRDPRLPRSLRALSPIAGPVLTPARPHRLSLSAPPDRTAPPCVIPFRTRSFWQARPALPFPLCL